MDYLLQVCKKLNFIPKLCLEAGAAHCTTSMLKDFVNNGTECILVEASPRLAFCLEFGFNNDNGKNFMDTWPVHNEPPFDNPGWGKLKNVKLINAAIVDKPGKVKFFERNASSFVEGITSPAKVNDHYVENDKDVYIVDGITIDQIDPGNIDLLAADCEGSEFFVLKYLISRPKIIALETHGQSYKNPFLKEIIEWMNVNNYGLIDQTESDSLFLKE